MPLPTHMYRDPADVIEFRELRSLRQRLGCSACVYRGDEVLGRHLCGVPGRQPNKQGYCRAWEALDALEEAA